MADKRLKAFVTHGGLGSTTEVAYSGKPALMVPIFGVQPYKADMLARRRGAIAFSKYDLKNPEKLNSAVRSLVYDLKYKNNAQTLLDVLSNQPIDPKQNLMKNLEFAMKFPNLRSQVPAINQVGTIAHYYLDVVAFLTILAGFSLYVLYSLLLKIIRRVVSKKF